MMGQIVPVTFLNRDGLRLFGMFHEPARSVVPDLAIILLSPGVKMRVAPHRLYNKMAERFIGLGYRVLRFDFYGLGDSEGEARETYLADLYGAIQVGRYVDDTIAAMDWMQRTHGVSQFVLAGLCGGAMTGLLAGQQDQRVKSLLAIGIPVILDGSNIDFSQYMTDGQLRETGVGYLRKLTDPRSWRSWIRFLTFRSHYRLIFKSVVRAVTRRPQAQHDSSRANVKGNINPWFAPAFQAMVSSARRLLLIFSGGDRLYWEFEEKFFGPYRHQISNHATFFDVHVIKEANHILSFAEWQHEMLECSCAWLLRHHSGCAGVSPEGARGGADR